MPTNGRARKQRSFEEGDQRANNETRYVRLILSFV